jgi:acetyl-CoA carboxylase biotin carboxyl carrier protein
MELRPEDIAEILRIFADSELEDLRLEIGSTKLELSKHGGVLFGKPGVARDIDAAQIIGTEAAPAAAAAPGDQGRATNDRSDGLAPSEKGLLELHSPLLGVFYRRPAPDQAPFLELGQQVGPDDPVCIIDVMKMFTRVPAGLSGELVEICVADGTLVEFGQTLMRFRPA